jgi:hypothetical protein
MPTNARELAQFVHAIAGGGIPGRASFDAMKAFTDCGFSDNPAINGVGLGLAATSCGPHGGDRQSC